MWSLSRLKRTGLRPTGSLSGAPTTKWLAPCVVLALLVSSPCYGQPKPKVEVFTLSTIAMMNTHGATIYYVDGISQVENFLSAGLPKDPGAAESIVKDRWGRLGREGNQRLQHAGVGLGRSVQLGVNRAPAIVFDGKAIVYGVTDVAQALEIYRRSAAAGGGGR
jgi:integrating conjugative element protein (TIGR03757 family)